MTVHCALNLLHPCLTQWRRWVIRRWCFLMKPLSTRLDVLTALNVRIWDFENPTSLSCSSCLLFNDGHVLQLWSETVAVRRRMIYGLDDTWWPYDNRERMWPKYPDICLYGWGKTSTSKFTRPGIEFRPAAWELTMLLLDHGCANHATEGETLQSPSTAVT